MSIGALFGLMSAFTGIERLLYAYRASLLWLASGVTMLIMLVDNLSRIAHDNGPSYPIRELLISYSDGVIRRGLSGEIVVVLQAWFGGAHWVWSFVLISAATLCLTALVIRLFRHLPDDPALALLVLAPWGLSFFTFDMGGSMRKEIFGYLAITLVLQGIIASTSSRAIVWAMMGTALFLTAIWVHEAIFVLWPVFALSLALVAIHWRAAGLAYLALAGFAGAVGLASVLYLASLPSADPLILCAAVHVFPCEEPFIWMNNDVDYGVAFMLERRKIASFPIYLGFYILGLLPFLAVRSGAFGRYTKALLIGVASVSVLPLFAVSVDWGRWMQMAFFPLGLLTVGGLIAGIAHYQRRIPAWGVVIYLSSWSLPHSNPNIDFKGVYILPALAGLVILSLFFQRMKARFLRETPG